jgi:thiol-disulfide isomerase/thioredoxin
LLAGCAAADETESPEATTAVEQKGATWPWELKPLEPLFVLGGSAPDFTLEVMSTLPGGTRGAELVTLSELKGSVVFLNFWNTGCGPCIAEHGTLSWAAQEYRDRGVRFLGIVDIDTPESLGRFEKKYGPTSYPNLHDRRGEVRRDYNARGWPLHVIVDAEGRAVWWAPGGPIKWEFLIGLLEDLLAGRAPAVTRSRA